MAVQDNLALLAMLAVHACVFIAPSVLLKPCKATKELNLSTYFLLTRVKIQKNFVIFILGYLLSKFSNSSESNFSASSAAFDMVTMFVSFSVFLYGGFVYPMNALSDLEDDRKEKPNRPLPAGLVSEPHAWVFTVVNLVLALISGYMLHGWPLVRVYGVFIFVNVIYSFLLRPLPILIPLLFITITSPLRLYMGSLVAGHLLPSPLFGLAYEVYLGLQFVRKIILQSEKEMSKMWLVTYIAVAAALIWQLDLSSTVNLVFTALAFIPSC